MEPGSVFLVLCALIVAGVAGGWLAVHINLPAILGELAAGALLALALSGGIPFWQEHEDMLEVLGQVGLCALLFSVGLEIRMRDIASVGPASAGVAFIGVIMPFILGYGVSLLFGLTPLVAIFVGASLTATSVGITAEVLSELEIIGSKSSKIILNAAVLDDVIGLFILTLVSSIAFGEEISVSSITMLLGVVAAFFLVVLIAVRPVISRLMSFIEKTYGDNGTAMTSFAYLMFISFGAAAIGLDVIVGAFIAGLSLSESRVRHHISASFRPFISVLASLFFVLIGTRMDLTLLNPLVADNRPVLVLSMGLLVAAVAGKLMSGLAVVRDRENRLVIGAGMIPRGEVGLICGNIGLMCGALPGDVFSSLLLVIMFTSFIGPVFLRFIVPRRLSFYPRIPIDSEGEEE
ncbi:MAG: cation:proton antiporter [Desulfomonilia bacterium]|uniref:High-affinity Na(+)/H(+) antiporter NhaS3 n=1 Tax=anaerobic digester metagenome TaxID=1263854 RepID=A0A485LWS6_9ZZZZ|nr:cation:proton antiporter [Pseudomonadota bacterium]HON38744.1 cation:proton antiporter [Deltaproteobacteria bacterium]HRS56585.1 cation:proton antiporter [Desulfomonilia bacterium]HPD21907.1 cation:proton antiporter [Deltaproteobacteria bacterium]HPX18460.1 cation:proton antiporter [Deltaproteobacteria bacterium]